MFYKNTEIFKQKSYMILLLIVIVSSMPFLSSVLFWGDDINAHLLRIVSVAEELGNGQFPVRMETELNNGYGYPWSIYYCDIFLYPAAILYKWGVSLRECYHLYVIFVNAMTTGLAYLAFGKIARNESIRLLGTGLYVLCIYRLVNLNVRAAVGEYTAMAFLPLIVVGLYLIYTKESPGREDWMYLAFGMSGVVMSHILTGGIIAINIAILCFALLKRTLTKKVLISFLKAVGVTIGITAWFWVPFLDYYLNHVTLVQNSDLRLLSKSTVDFVFLFQLFAPGKQNGHYITIGLPLILGIGVVSWCFMRYRENGGGINKNLHVLKILSGLAFLNILFVTKFFPWGRIQNYLGLDSIGYQIGTIQFAWRFLGPALVLLAFAIVIALNLMDRNKEKDFRTIFFSLIAAIVLAVGFFHYQYTDEGKTFKFDAVRPYSKSDRLYLLDKTNRSMQDIAMPRVLSGNVRLRVFGRKGSDYKIYIENKTKETAMVSMPIYNYRYFNAYNKNGVLLSKEALANNCFSVYIPGLYHGDVIVRFVPPYQWRLAELISISFIISIVWGMLSSRYLFPKPKSPAWPPRLPKR